ncbi:MAG: transaldolase [Nocardioidaceae bacterium]|nr:transaldolase [Marmoricola sp.]
MTDHLKDLSAAGVSIWLDDLSRSRIESGNLSELIRDRQVVGVTTNPSIFSAALASSEHYAAQVRQLAEAKMATDEAIFELMTTDVRLACDLMAGPFEDSQHRDGRVSIEVPPALAHDVEGTVAMAHKMAAAVGRANVMVKIPATQAGLQAITSATAAGLDINVTLIFGLEQYQGVIDAYLTGLEQAALSGHDLSQIHSVASLFVSRLDTEIDRRLELANADDRLLGQAGVANARLAYQLFEESLRTPRWKALASKGANPQRPLWASTGVKNPSYPDTMYVLDLVVEDTVNTMPEATLMAVSDHGNVVADQVRPFYLQSQTVLQDLKSAGIDYSDVIQTLLEEGLAKFDKAWADVQERVEQSLAAASSAQS